MAEQLSLLSLQKSNVSHRWVVAVDGASRGNPGRAGAGIYITKDGTPIVKVGFFLGICTNNEAEYLALILGLCHIRELVALHDTVHIVSDSQLLVRQLLGEYRVRQPALVCLHKRACKLLTDLHFSIEHVRREYNQEADALANDGIAYERPIPDHWKHCCQFAKS